MRKLIPILATLVATAAMAVPTGVALGEHAYGGNHVDATDLYVRDNQGRVIGRLYRGEHFTIERIAENGWAYGYAYGNVQKCGYIIDPHDWLNNATDGHADTRRC